jgi:Thiopurine S-methyltransferase (TPMT)
MSVLEEMNEYTRWEARFATPDYGFGKEPNYFLKSCRPLLARHGRALAVADGEGRNGVWLAEQGLDVLSLDFSPTAQNQGPRSRRRARCEGHFH